MSPPRIEVPLMFCEHCGKAIEPRRFTRRGHSRGIKRGIRFCSGACRNLARVIERKGYIDKHGYRRISLGSRAAGVREEHRVVMEQMLGRKLEAYETVHHKNGIRHDNRPENLELWTGRHGRGQRAVDVGLSTMDISTPILAALSMGC
jgi:hypothetical protein